MKVAALVLHYGDKRRASGVVKTYRHWGTVLVLSRDFHVQAEHDVRNEGMRLLSPFDVVFISDDDEFILREDQEKVVSEFERDRDLDTVMMPILNYAYGLKSAYKGVGHLPIVAVKPKPNFYDARCFRSEKIIRLHNHHVHHMGFAISPAEIEKKKEFYREVKPNEVAAIDAILKSGAFPIRFPEWARFV
jgi:hypothetical protein